MHVVPAGSPGAGEAQSKDEIPFWEWKDWPTLMAAVLARAANGARFDTETLTSANGFAGAGSIFRFLPNGEVQRSLAILEVEPWGFGIRSPSPESFETFKALSN